MSRRNVALFGATIVSVIYGITFTIAKGNATVHRCLWFYFVTGKRRHAFILAVLVVYAEGKIALNDFPELLLRHSLVSLLTCLPF
jgi:hypothetical protein